MINLELYKIFYVVAEIGNITKASEVLNISQPAITKHIKNLEEQLGEPLFIRTKKGVILNDYGKMMFLNVKKALTLLEESEKELANSKKITKGHIKIGISTTLIRKYLLNYLQKFHNLYPEIIFDIYTDTNKELIKELKNGTIDFSHTKLRNVLQDIKMEKFQEIQWNLKMVYCSYRTIIKRLTVLLRQIIMYLKKLLDM